MINSLKIKATPIKAMAQDQLMKKLESGKTITALNSGDRHQLKVELETDIETIKKIALFIQELGKSGAANN